MNNNLRTHQKLRIYLALTLVIVLPEGLMINLGFQSASFGSLVSWIICIFLLSFNFGSNSLVDKTFVRVALIAVISCTLSLVLGIFINKNFDFIRFSISLCLLIIELLAVFMLAFRLGKVNNEELDKLLKTIAKSLLAFSFIILLYWLISPPLAKPMIFFTEPSHYSVVASPFFMYYIIRNRGKKAFVFSCLILLSAILLENMTLLVSVVISIFILNKKYFIAFLGLAVISLPLIGPAFSTYISLRASGLLDPENNNNLSSLVYMQGWEYVISSVKNFKGIGLGFQQLGQIKLVSNSQELLEIMGYPLNQNDGSFLFSKLFVEFGWLSIPFVFIYLKLLYPLYNRLSLMRFNNNWSLFISTTMIGFLIPLFVRNSSYFNPGIFIFLVSIAGFIIAKRNKLYY